MKSAHTSNSAASVALSPAFEIPKDGRFHLARAGEFPGTAVLDDGTELSVIQVIDDESLATIANRFAEDKAAGAPDLLIDRDHLSHDLKNETLAEGWIQNVEKSAGDLYGDVRLSAQGEADIKGGHYRFVSSVFDVEPIGQKNFTDGCRVRPIKLLEAGLTNRPQIKGLAAISNRENRPPIISDKIAKILGLAPGATECEALPVVARLLNRADESGATLKRLREEKAALQRREADYDLEACGIAETDPSYLGARHALISNPSSFIPALIAVQNRARKQAIANEWTRSVAYANALESAKRKSPQLFREISSGSVSNSARGTTALKPHERELLDKDEAAYNARQFHQGDADCAPMPMTVSSLDQVRKIFMDGVQKYIDKGMSFRAAWLAAKQNNPSAFHHYAG